MEFDTLSSYFFLWAYFRYLEMISVVAVVDLKVWSCKLRLDATWVHKLLLCRSLAAFNRWISIIELIFADDNLFACNWLHFFFSMLIELITLLGLNLLRMLMWWWMLVTKYPWGRFYISFALHTFPGARQVNSKNAKKGQRCLQANKQGNVMI